MQIQPTPRLKCSRKQIYIALLLFVFPMIAKAQTPTTINLGDGTLTFNASSEIDTCTRPSPGGPQEVEYTTYIYDTFSYTQNGVTTPLDGTTSHVFTSGSSCNPAPTDGPNPLPMQLPVGATIKFSMSGRGNYSATISSLVDPLYKVVSIVYATPGNASSSGFTNGTTNGTTTTIGSSFTNANSTTYGLDWRFVSGTITFGASTTTGNSSAFTETIAQASSVSNASASSGPNTVSHGQDLFLIWLNPEVELTAGAFNTSDLTYGIHSQYQNGSEQKPDIVQVFGTAMQSNNGSSTVPLSILKHQYNTATGQYDLPGLAHICANQMEYLNDCPNGGQCGCTPSDFAGILSQDPMINATTADNPLNFTTSGASTCGSPTFTANCRYVPVPASPGSSIPMTTLLSGPNCSGCNRPINAYTQTDSTSSTQTYSESVSDTVSFSRKFGTGPIGGNVTLQNSWTWTNSESVGATNGVSNQLQYSLSSSTTGCYQDVLVYEDTVYHTFVTRQAPGNTSCP